MDSYSENLETMKMIEEITLRARAICEQCDLLVSEGFTKVQIFFMLGEI